MFRSCRNCFLGACAALAMMPGAAHAASLYTGPAHRPGPDLLYEPPATAPQLTNTNYWQASPILISGASAYRKGEFLYQDFLYDDHGANEEPDPNDPRTGDDTFSRPNGTYTYPADAAYANNSADLVELRVKPLKPSTAFRVTLNTLKDPSKVAFSLALGGTPGTTHAFPFGANVSAPADIFVTVHPGPNGLVAKLTDAATGAPLSPSPIIYLDTTRRQIEVRVARSVWEPAGRTVRLAAGVGLWDTVNNRYLVPQQSRSATSPGGSGSNPSPAAFFNVGFRFDEPVPDVGDPPGTAQNPAWWRDRHQGEALATGDISDFYVNVDFNKLAANANDDMPGQPGGVPQTGPMDRILASHFEPAQGVDYTQMCFPSGGPDCTGPYQGQLQPYAIYIPQQPVPPAGYGMTLLLHSLGATYNQYLGSRHQSQFGERGPGSIVITPLARGPDGFYEGLAEADVFEVWADVASRYPLDQAWTVVTGYSMGAIGTFKLAEQFPDLFAKAQPTVGDSSDINMIASLRNIPVLMWNASADELVPPTSYLPTADELDALGYRYELDVFQAEHLTLAIHDQYAPAAAFLGTTPALRNPPHVTFVADPSLDQPEHGLVADHAYWISDVKTRGSGQGTVDAFSHGYGTGDPTASATQFGSGTLPDGNLGTLAYTSRFKTWSDPPVTPKANRLDLTATNVSSLTLHPGRAKVPCTADFRVTSDGPLTIKLVNCRRTITVP